MSQDELDKYLTAQAQDYERAYTEIAKGKKLSHWMWYIFPQLAGLGYSDMAKRYALQDVQQAAAYLHHPLLGPRLLDMANLLLQHKGLSAHTLFGSPDDVKLRSCMTLFSQVPNAPSVFKQVLDQYYNGQADEKTLQLLQQ